MRLVIFFLCLITIVGCRPRAEGSRVANASNNDPVKIDDEVAKEICVAVGASSKNALGNVDDNCTEELVKKVKYINRAAAIAECSNNNTYPDSDSKTKCLIGFEYQGDVLTQRGALDLCEAVGASNAGTGAIRTSSEGSATACAKKLWEAFPPSTGYSHERREKAVSMCKADRFSNSKDKTWCLIAVGKNYDDVCMNARVKGIEEHSSKCNEFFFKHAFNTEVVGYCRALSSDKEKVYCLDNIKDKGFNKFRIEFCKKLKNRGEDTYECFYGKDYSDMSGNEDAERICGEMKTDGFFGFGSKDLRNECMNNLKGKGAELEAVLACELKHPEGLARNLDELVSCLRDIAGKDYESDQIYNCMKGWTSSDREKCFQDSGKRRVYED